jgi:hypothetical protein
MFHKSGDRTSRTESFYAWEFPRFRDPFRLIENPWVTSTKDISQVSMFGPEVKRLKGELIDVYENFTYPRNVPAEAENRTVSEF